MPFLTAGTGGPVPRNGVMGSERRGSERIATHSKTGREPRQVLQTRRPLPNPGDRTPLARLPPEGQSRHGLKKNMVGMLPRVGQHRIRQKTPHFAGLKWPKQNALQASLNMVYISL